MLKRGVYYADDSSLHIVHPLRLPKDYDPFQKFSLIRGIVHFGDGELDACRCNPILTSMLRYACLNGEKANV